MSAWESTRTPSLRKSASCSIIALRNNSESPILSSSATVHSPSVDWSLLKEPHGGRLRQQPLPFTHSRGHYLCRSRRTEPISLLHLAPRCTALRSRLCQSGVKHPQHKHRSILQFCVSGLSMRNVEGWPTGLEPAPFGATI